MQSFLNMIDLATGRQIRVSELGYYACRPSFAGEDIRFYRDGQPYLLSLKSGRIVSAGEVRLHEPVYVHEQNVHGQTVRGQSVRLNRKSDPCEGIAYMELILETDGEQRVLGRFMGSDDSLGDCPFSSDGRTVVFFGYPSPDGIT